MFVTPSENKLGIVRLQAGSGPPSPQRFAQHLPLGNASSRSSYPPSVYHTDASLPLRSGFAPRGRLVHVGEKTTNVQCVVHVVHEVSTSPSSHASTHASSVAQKALRDPESPHGTPCFMNAETSFAPVDSHTHHSFLSPSTTSNGNDSDCDNKHGQHHRMSTATTQMIARLLNHWVDQFKANNWCVRYLCCCWTVPLCSAHSV